MKQKRYRAIEALAFVGRDVELKLLSSLLSDPKLTAHALSAGLTDEHFASADIGFLASIAFDLFRTRGAVDPVSLTSEIIERDQVDRGGKALAEITHTEPDQFQFQDYLGRILASNRIHAVYDQIRQCETEIIKPGLSLLQREQAAERAIGKLVSALPDGEQSYMDSRAFASYAAESFRRAEAGHARQRVPSGIPSIDHEFYGFEPARVSLICGRTSHFKTAFATWVSVMKARLLRRQNQRGQVLYFSAEMGHDAMSHRVLSALSGVSAEKIGMGKCTHDESEKVKAALEEMLTDIRISVDCKTRPDNAYLMSRALSAHAIEPVRLVVFDYLEYTGEKHQSKDIRLENALLGGHAVAKRLNCPVLFLCQLSRQLDGRGPGARPQLSDIRYTGAGEQIAAMVGFVYHEFTHYIQCGKQPPFEVDENALDFLVRKNTNGPIGDLGFRVYPNTGTFIDPYAEKMMRGELIS